MIDEEGEQKGVIALGEALQMAQERGLDLIQVTDKVDPPVCKITDHGKYLYSQKKKERKANSKQKVSELKVVRLTFNISQHDMETRVRQAEKFLTKGDKVRIEMKLRGRERALKQFAEEKINKYLEVLRGLVPIKIEQGLKKQPRGLTMIVAKE
ncbi:translation initiation factor IF-3 [Candidatus Parcubacteria bacterium]|nr:translation initiation factor IF-3 [Candidatus Parcubacteria bacterium]